MVLRIESEYVPLSSCNILQKDELANSEDISVSSPCLRILPKAFNTDAQLSESILFLCMNFAETVTVASEILALIAAERSRQA